MTSAAVLRQGGAAGKAGGAIAVIIPTLDEEQSIADVVRSLPRAIVSRVIVADGGSRDATVARAQAAGAEVIDTGPGYGRACLAATMAAEDADIVLFMRRLSESIYWSAISASRWARLRPTWPPSTGGR